jgi:hypothetical protein
MRKEYEPIIKKKQFGPKNPYNDCMRNSGGITGVLVCDHLNIKNAATDPKFACRLKLVEDDARGGNCDSSTVKIKPQ